MQLTKFVVNLLFLIYASVEQQNLDTELEIQEQQSFF